VSDAETRLYQAISTFFLLFKLRLELKGEASWRNPLRQIGIELQSRPSPVVISAGCGCNKK
jgi:hypothetical protein